MNREIWKDVEHMRKYLKDFSKLCKENPKEAHKQSRQLLIGAGIMTKKGNLKKPYKHEPEKINRLWLVGQLNGYHNGAWEFKGIFDSETEAMRNCVTSDYFYHTCVVNESLGDDIVKAKEYSYPLLNPEKILKRKRNIKENKRKPK